LRGGRAINAATAASDIPHTQRFRQTHGMARREEQIELNRGGSFAEGGTHDVLGPTRRSWHDN
jgi:hypothetical protein